MPGPTPSSPRSSRSPRRGRGFTLIEVILAVSLSTILIGAIASAVYMNTRVLYRQQKAIEQSQIARNVLLMIKSDIRAAIQYIPADVTGLDELNVSQAAIAGIAAGADLSETDTSQIDPGALAGGMGGDVSGSGEDPADPASEATQNATQNIAGGGTQVIRPGLYGNASEIMVDISRLPRVDQYDPVVLGSENQAVTLPSDIKTVSYFVTQESVESSRLSVGRDAAASGGLYRRQLDRAVAAYSADVAGTLAALGQTRLIANEVIGVQFRYFDGENWVNEWNSENEGGFPTAIEINILVDNEREITSEVSYGMQLNPESGTMYRAVVNLPLAQTLSDEELALINGASQ